MKKRVYIIMAALCCLASASAQEANWLWPIAGQEAGEGIVFRPQDYIENEWNYADLFVAAPEGSVVVAPCDGVVSFCGMSYQSSLTSSMTFGAKGSWEERIAATKDDVVKRGMNPRYLSTAISLRHNDGASIHISGLRTDSIIPTGWVITQGDTLGTVHYAYRKIAQPCIHISVSRDNRAADPMKPFGLSSTFIEEKPRTPKATLSRAEATEDYHLLAAAVKELYPSLSDFMTDSVYDAFVASEIARFDNQMSRAEFGRRMLMFNNRIHDSHLWFTLGISTSLAPVRRISPLLFGKVDSTVRVISATEPYLSYLGREISHINGRSVDSLCTELLPYTEQLYDAHVQSVADQQLAAFMFYYYFGQIPHAQEKDTRFTFADGGEESIPLSPLRSTRFDMDHYKHYRQALLTVPQESFLLSMENDSTAMVRLRTFSIMETEADSIVQFIDSLQIAGVENLIFDLRRNPGGDAEVLNRLLCAILPKPAPREGGYSMVNAQKFFSPTLNLVPGETLFEDFKEMPPKKGYYKMDTVANIAPTDTTQKNTYTGRVYVIVDAGSASASTLFASTLKRAYRGFIVGRETATAYHTMTARKFADIQLPNSLFKCHIPMVRVVSDTLVNEDFPAMRGLMPHLEIPISMHELTEDGQYLLTRTLELIDQGTYLPPLPEPEPERKKPSTYLLLLATLPIWLALFVGYKKKSQKPQ